jgi:SAM-dependent methyltransferase
MDWAASYATQRTPWDLRMVTPPLRALLGEGRHLRWGLPERARVAVPGCGRGHDLRAFSAAGMRVTGFDLAPAAVEEARQLLAWNRAEGRVLCRDVLGLAHEFGGAFDLVYDYTCFCALPRYLRGRYGREVAAILAPRGVLLHLSFPDDPRCTGGGDRPPFLIARRDVEAAFGRCFELEEQFDAVGSVPERTRAERWYVWRRREVADPRGPRDDRRPDG